MNAVLYNADNHPFSLYLCKAINSMAERGTDPLTVSSTMGALGVEE